MQAEGAWVFGGGLPARPTATVVRVADGDGRCMTDGPFAETKEQLGGFWVIKAADLDEALAWAAQGRGGLPGAGRGAAVPGRGRRH